MEHIIYVCVCDKDVLSHVQVGMHVVCVCERLQSLEIGAGDFILSGFTLFF